MQLSLSRCLWFPMPGSQARCYASLQALGKGKVQTESSELSEPLCCLYLSLGQDGGCPWRWQAAAKGQGRVNPLTPEGWSVAIPIMGKLRAYLAHAGLVSSRSPQCLCLIAFSSAMAFMSKAMSFGGEDRVAFIVKGKKTLGQNS